MNKTSGGAGVRSEPPGGLFLCWMRETRAAVSLEAALVLENEMSGSETFSTTAGAGRRKGGWSLRKLLDRESSLGILLMLPGASC